MGALCHGSRLFVPGILRITSDVKEGDVMAIFTQKGEIVAVGRATIDYRKVLESSKGVAASLNRVLMPRDLYPKMWR